MVRLKIETLLTKEEKELIEFLQNLIRIKLSHGESYDDVGVKQLQKILTDIHIRNDGKLLITAETEEEKERLNEMIKNSPLIVKGQI